MTELDRPNPPFPGKITHHSAELFWKIPRKEPRLSVLLQQSGGHNVNFETIYTGFGKKTDVKELLHDTNYKFRIRFTAKDDSCSDWSPLAEVTTKTKPLTGDDLHRAVNNRNINTIKKLLTTEDIEIDAPDKMGYSPLMNAGIKGYDDVSETLLDHGANPHYSNTAGKNSLMLACYHGSVRCIDVLLKYGASWSIKDKSGSAPFHCAIDGGHMSVIERILQECENVDEPDDRSGWSPLMRLVTVNGSTSIAKLLIDKGANVNFKDKAGKIVLMAACLNGNKSMVQLLVDSGADLWTENEFGKTAYDMAKAFERRAVMKYIEEMEEIYPRPPSLKVQSHIDQDVRSCPSSPLVQSRIEHNNLNIGLAPPEMLSKRVVSMI